MSEPIKRFYKETSVFSDEQGHGVKLDARILKTPSGAAFRAPAQELAEAMAAEWAAQAEHITPASMPLTQLAFAAIDITPGRSDEIAREIANYSHTDLILHRAAAPPALVARQAATWDPLVAWASARFRRALPVVTGVIAAPRDAQFLATMEREVDDLDHFRRTALAQAVALAGSAFIGFALLEGRIGAETAFAAAALDDLWSLENWGEDAPARARLDRLKADLEAVARFIAAL